jgi:DNA-binding NtrC family response regulator
MTRITIEAPGVEAYELVVEKDLRYLIGREPDPGRSRVPSEDVRVNIVPVASPSVSANHCLVWRDDEALRVQELGSRNGTWLGLPANVPVSIADDGAISLRLARYDERGGDADQPEDAHWSHAGEFAPGVVTAVEGWLVRAGTTAQVSLRSRRSTSREPLDPGAIPLASGQELHLVSAGTQDVRWPRLLQQVWAYVARQNEIFENEETTRQEGLILASPAIRRAHQQVIDAAKRGSRLLLVGPSGAGKEGLARAYHRHARPDGPFVARNCSMFSRELLISQLFGAEPGAFTGCTQRIIGAVERAHGGTLFLDEIADLPAEVQPMLLRFLDSGEYERMGSAGATRHSDARIVSATNKDLRGASLRGEFRQDLWYRLSIHVVEVPPLNRRREDVTAYLKSRSLSPGLSAHQALAPAALAMVMGHDWAGNFRELANFVERLPSAKDVASIDAKTCRDALDAGALVPTRPATTPVTAEPGWAELAIHAADAFRSDFNVTAPATWDDVKDYIEKYFKPLLFATLSGAAESPGRAELDIAAVAAVLDADRGTAIKHVNRYFERFANARKT